MKRTCPRCGSENIGANVVVVECRDILEWVNNRPQTKGCTVHSRTDEGLASEYGICPTYTCECGEEFDRPAIVDGEHTEERP